MRDMQLLLNIYPQEFLILVKHVFIFIITVYICQSTDFFLQKSILFWKYFSSKYIVNVSVPVFAFIAIQIKCYLGLY